MPASSCRLRPVPFLPIPHSSLASITTMKSTATRTMKSIATLLACTLVTLAPVAATVTINGEFGPLQDSNGGILADTATLWAIIYDQNDDGVLPGGLGLNESLVAADSGIAYTAFVGQTLVEDLMIAGDRVIALGDFNAFETGGVAVPVLAGVDLAARGLTNFRPYGFYWFPGSTASVQNFDIGGFQVGGINELINYTGTGTNYIGTQIPGTDGTMTTSLFDQAMDGNLPSSRFTAVAAIPEPSAALLGLAGLLAFVRRRRA